MILKQISVISNKNKLLNILQSSFYKLKKVTINIGFKSRDVRSLYAGIASSIVGRIFKDHIPDGVELIQNDFENFFFSTLLCYLINKKNNFNNFECIIIGAISGMVCNILTTIRDGIIANGKDWNNKINITNISNGDDYTLTKEDSDPDTKDEIFNIEKYYVHEYE